MARLIIVGGGVVGAATARGFSEAGHRVQVIDVSSTRLQELTMDGFDATSELALGDEPTFVFLTLPTPHRGREYDLTAFENGTAAVGRALGRSAGHHTVVVRSTVPPGTTDGVVRTVLERESGKTAYVGFSLASNPEFLRAASASEDFLRPWMTVIGSRSKEARDALSELLRPFGGELRTFEDPAVAEFIKCAHNIYNASKISFWNEMWLVADRLGIDINEVSSTVALSAEGSFNPFYGTKGGSPYGGACLPKDTLGFLGFATDIGIEMPMLAAVVEVNEMLTALTQQRLETAPQVDRVIDLTDAQHISDYTSAQT